MSSRNEKPKYQEPGYYGMPLEDLPDGFREMVQEAVAVTGKPGSLVTLMVSEQKRQDGRPAQWPFGEDLTDVFVVDRGIPTQSHHIINGTYLHVTFSGMENRMTRVHAMTRLGLEIGDFTKIFDLTPAGLQAVGLREYSFDGQVRCYQPYPKGYPRKR